MRCLDLALLVLVWIIVFPGLVLHLDKYLEDFNWVVATAAIIRVLMSGRTMFIFSKYVYGYVDLAYHSLLVACFLWGLIGVKFIIFLAHALRSIAVTFAIGESRNRLKLFL